jgi:hypothetical protein
MMSRATIDAALETERRRRHHGMLLRQDLALETELSRNWHGLLEQTKVLVASTPPIRVRPATLYMELEDLLAEWRELWNSEWFIPELDHSVTSEWTLKDVIAHVASWTAEMRIQSEILASGSDVPYQILFEKTGGPKAWNAEQVQLRRMRSAEALTGEIERETARLQDLLFKVEQPILAFKRPIGIAMAASPAEPWIRSIAGIAELRCFHDRHHLGRIREWNRNKFSREQ